MTSSTCCELDESTVSARGELLTWLHRTFGNEFRLAARICDEMWHYVAVDREISRDQNVLDRSIAAACNEVVHSRQPIVLPGHEHLTVVVPMPTAADEVAIGAAGDLPADVLQRIADLWHTAASSRRKVEQYQSENEFFAEQLSDDLEELTFLRSMVEHLEVSDDSHDLMALAQSTLPLLNESIKAECLSLLMAPGGTGPEDAVPAIKLGEHEFSDSLLMRVVHWFGDSARDKPVVKNRIVSTPEGEHLPGVRELLLVPVASRSAQMGWLLAINRRWPADARPDSPWPLSQLEFGSSEASLLSTTASMLATHASNLDLFREKERILINVVRSLVSALDAKDEYTCGHSERVALFAKILAEQVGYDEDQCERLYLTGLLHDVGKIGVTDAVLNKKGRLTDAEFAEIKKHPDEGWAILQDLEQLRYVLPGVLFHHERVDGGGYPDGLHGEEIPLDGRLLAVVDAYDAMTSDRPYRSGMPPMRAQEILRSGAGTQWDADLIDHFFAVFDKIENVRQNYRLRDRPTRTRGRSE